MNRKTLATPKHSEPNPIGNTLSIGLSNSAHGYGLISILLHWLVAIIVLGLFGLGLWMTELTYYDDWYRRAPDIHKSIGVLLFFIMLGRLVWRWSNTAPEDEASMGLLQRRLAHSIHSLLYLLLFAVMISGYLISTADGRSIDVFGWFTLPAVISNIANLEDTAGEIHWYLALTVISLTSIHTLAAFKHHFINRDRTLKKMLGITDYQTMTSQRKSS